MPKLSVQIKSGDLLVDFSQSDLEHAACSRRCRRRQRNTHNLTGQLPALVFSKLPAPE